MYSGSTPSSLTPMKLMNCQLLKDIILLKPETSNYRVAREKPARRLVDQRGRRA